MPKNTPSRPGRLRELIDDHTVVMPGAVNALTARAIERAGFEAYNGVQGKNIVANGRGKGLDRQQVMIEHEDNSPRMGFAEPANVRTLITGINRKEPAIENVGRSGQSL